MFGFILFFVIRDLIHFFFFTKRNLGEFIIQVRISSQFWRIEINVVTPTRVGAFVKRKAYRNVASYKILEYNKIQYQKIASAFRWERGCSSNWGCGEPHSLLFY
jgi:hypothetical protein